MNKEPTTYEELIRYKKCVDLTKYYEVSMTELNQIYDFLEKNENGQILCTANTIALRNNNEVVMIINANCKSTAIDGLTMSNNSFSIIPHFTPSSSSYGSSSGFSSNNNNNNNNNNNR